MIVKTIVCAIFFCIGILQAQIKPFKVLQWHHSEIALNIDLKNQRIKGVTKFTVTPYFYPLKQLVLQAKDIDIQKVSLQDKSVNYHYKDHLLHLFFNKTYTLKDTLHIIIKYTYNIPKNPYSRYDLLLSSALKNNFIAPDHSSQVASQSLYLTVPNAYQTFAIGELSSQKQHWNNTRTDHWQLAQARPFRRNFFAVGKFQKQMHKINNFPYIFYGTALANTLQNARKLDQMIQFFQQITGVGYPYKTYHQLQLSALDSLQSFSNVVLLPEEAENLPFERLYERVDKDFQKALQLAKQWTHTIFFKQEKQSFLNDAIAGYLAYIWIKKRYKKNVIQVYQTMLLEQLYKSNTPSKFHVSKAILVLQMLHQQMGDKAFFKGLKKYFTTYQNKLIEPNTFRQVLEQVSGKDLTLFFFQWIETDGYPLVKAYTDYNTLEKTLILTFEQTLPVYQLPVKVRFYYKNYIHTEIFYLDKPQNSFTIVYKEIPKWISINADKELLGKFTTSKNLSQWIYQYRHSPYYEDKNEALNFLLTKQSYQDVLPVLQEAFKDPFATNRIVLLEGLDLADKFAKRKLINQIENLAYNDPVPFVRAAAIKALGKLVSNTYYGLFMQTFESPHPALKGAALEALYYINSKEAIKLAKGLIPKVKHSIGYPLSKLYIQQKNKEQMAFIAPYILQGMYLMKDKDANQLFKDAMFWIGKSKDIEAVKILVDDMVKKGNTYRKYNFHLEVINLIRELILAQESLQGDRTLFIKALQKGLQDLTM